MRTYIRCMVANRATLAGFMLIILAICVAQIKMQDPELQFSLIASLCMVGFFLLCVTRFGYGTWEAYQRAHKRLVRGKELRLRETPTHYCGRTGVALALREHAQSRPN